MLPDINYEQPQTALESVIVRALRTMNDEGYSDHTCTEHRLIWRHLLKFAAKRNINDVTPQLYEEFLAAHKRTRTIAGRARQKHGSAAAQQAMQSLVHFATYGVWKHRFTMKPRPALSVVFAQDLHAYLEYLVNERHLSSATVRGRRNVLEQFFLSLETKGFTEWTGLTASLITAFFTPTGHQKSVTLEVRSYALRLFFQFLFATGKVKRDWSLDVPHFRGFMDQAVPVVWPPHTVDALLQSVDRKSSCGKRNYAILLLAARLGIRASDIRALRLDSIHWNDDQIEFTQRKTGRKATLPLTEEVGKALIDYLLHGRPHSPHREVFLRIQAPFRPLGPFLRCIIKNQCRKAGITLPQGRMGLHSLRHALAQRLLFNDTPLETIADILGHTSLNATRVYAKVDLKQLRTAALDIEEVYHA